MDTKDLEKQAYTPIIKVAASILVLSFALKNVGIDFTPVMQAWTTRIANSIEVDYDPEIMKKLEQIEERLIRVEELAHEEGK